MSHPLHVSVSNDSDTVVDFNPHIDLTIPNNISDEPLVIEDGEVEVVDPLWNSRLIMKRS